TSPLLVSSATTYAGTRGLSAMMASAIASTSVTMKLPVRSWACRALTARRASSSNWAGLKLNSAAKVVPPSRCGYPPDEITEDRCDQMKHLITADPRDQCDVYQPNGSCTCVPMYECEHEP